MKSETVSVWRNYLPDISLLLSTIVWGLSFTIMKDILGTGISPGLFIFLRFSLGSVLLGIIAGKRIGGLGKEGLKAGLFLGVLIFAGFMSQTVGILHTTASKSAFITGLSAAIVPLILFIHKKRLPEPLVLLAIILATAGMYMLTGPAGGGFNFGDLLTLLCAAIFGIQIYIMGIATLKYDSLALTLVELMTTACLAAVILPFEDLQLQLSLKTITALIFMTLFATTIALWVQTWAQKRVPAVRAGLIFSAEPVFAYMFASAILDEKFNLLQKFGGAIIIIAIALTELIPLAATRYRKGKSAKQFKAL